MGPRYRAGSMASSRPRRTGVRRGLLIIGVAGIAAAGTVTFGPVLAGQPPVGSIAVSPTATPSPTASLAAVATPAIDIGPGLGQPGGLDPTPTQRPLPPPAAPTASTPPYRGGPALTTTLRQALQARLDQLRERFGIPGISVAIILPDGSRWVGVSGQADVKAAAVVTPSTGFAVASVSKTFTAALILALVGDGKIELDEPARTYLPGLTKIGPKITVRQLLEHTSGLRDYFFHPSIDRLLLADRDKRWDTRTTLAYVGKPYFEPGKGWHYSNTNYFVLGLIAEAVGRAPLATQLRERFFEPLGLDDTWYQPTDAAPSDLAHGYRFTSPDKGAPPIDLTDGTTIVPFTSVVTAAGGAGGIASSASDLAVWARALYGGDLLIPAVRMAMLDPSDSARYKASVPYGMGVQVLDIDGRRTFGHSGRLLGFRSAIRYLPDEDVSIAILTNQSRSDPGVIVRALRRVVFARPAPVAVPSAPVPPITLVP